MYVAIFEPKSYFGTEIYYHIDWRPILPNEFEAIKPFIPGPAGEIQNAHRTAMKNLRK